MGGHLPSGGAHSGAQAAPPERAARRHECSAGSSPFGPLRAFVALPTAVLREHPASAYLDGDIARRTSELCCRAHALYPDVRGPLLAQDLRPVGMVRAV